MLFYKFKDAHFESYKVVAQVQLINDGVTCSYLSPNMNDTALTVKWAFPFFTFIVIV